MSEAYWKGYNDFRVGIYSTDGYCHPSSQKDDYNKGQNDSEMDKQKGYDAR
jgi:hypothetical protein